MGLVLDVERLVGVDKVTPLTFAAGDFGQGLKPEDTSSGVLSMIIRPFGGDIYLGLAGKAASSTVDSWLILDKEPFGYTGDVRQLQILASADGIDVFVAYIDEA